jgi:hypothetical protein
MTPAYEWKHKQHARYFLDYISVNYNGPGWRGTDMYGEPRECWCPEYTVNYFTWLTRNGY